MTWVALWGCPNAIGLQNDMSGKFFFQLWCSPKCLHIKWESKSCPSDSRIGCKRVPTFVARLRRSNRPKISRSAAAAGCVGVAV